MTERPYVLLSCAMSVDGYIDDASPARLLLSNDADFDRVDEVRAGCDAILIGAETIRRDNPRLLVRSAQRRDTRVAAGLPPSPVKVTLTRTGNLDRSGLFFAAGDTARLVYCPTSAVGRASAVGDVATVVDMGADVNLADVLADLSRRGVDRLMVEGGGTVHTAFLEAGLVDELHLVVAPFFVGDPAAPRFVNGGRFTWDADHRMTLVEARQIGDVVLLRYLTPKLSS